MHTHKTTLASTIVSLLLVSIVVTLQLPIVHGVSFTAPQQVPMGTNLFTDSKLGFADNAPANGTALKADGLIKYADQNGNSHWDPGEPLAYDSNNDSIHEGIEPTIGGTVALGASLRVDPLVKFVDIGNTGRWSPGDAIIYDSNNNNLYTTGKPVIAGTPVVPSTNLVSDSRLKFIGGGSTWTAGNGVVYASNNGNFYNATRDVHIKFSDGNSNGHWDAGESMVYDSNLSGTYNLGEPVLYGPTPVSGALLKTDLKLDFVDTNRNGAWEAGEAVVYDSNGNGILEMTEPVLVLSNPILGSGLSVDSKLKFVDANSNSVWDQGETLVYDSVAMSYYNATIDPKIKYFDANGNSIYDSGDSVIYDRLGTGIYMTGDNVIAGPMPPNDGTATLTIDHHFHFVDSTLTGHWLTGDTVIYDPDSDHIYITGDQVVAGSTPLNGTRLTEPVIAGTAPPIGTLLRSDSKIKYLDANGNSVWNPGEAAVYDSNNDGVYDSTPIPADIVIAGTTPATGTLLSEPVIAGPVPSLGTALKSDGKVRFVDAANTGLWSPGEVVVYDSNGNGRYDRGEPVITGGAPGDGNWHSGEVVVYDSNSNSVYNTGEPVIYGTAPVNGTSQAVDPRIKYVDANNNSHWDTGETVAYDVNNNNIFDQGDLVVSGATPSSNLFLDPSTSLDGQGRIWLAWNEKPPGSSTTTTVYLKVGNGTSWSAKQAVTNGSFVDNGDFVTPLANQTMMILWSSNRSGFADIFYRLYSSAGSAPFVASPPVQLTSTTLYDRSPTAVQDRNGRIWVAWSRANAQSTSSLIYYKYYNGTAWSSDFPMPPASVSNLDQTSPFITQTKDGLIRMLWTSNDTTNSNLYYATTSGTMPTLPSTGIPSGSWSAKVHFSFGNTSDDDDRAFFLQSQDGNYWVFWQKSILVPSAEYVYYSTASDTAGTNWSGAAQMTSGSDSNPAAVENIDHLVWVFYGSFFQSPPPTGFSAGQQIVYEKTTTSYTGNDLGVRVLTTGVPLIRSAYPVNVTTVVQNYGNSAQTAILTLTANSTTLTTFAVSLPVGGAQRYYYNWSSPAWGRYTVTATLSSISPGNSPNNQDTFVTQRLRVTPPGDVNGDGSVNILDLALIAICYNTIPVQGTQCNGYVDANRDGSINIQDLALAAINWQKSD